MNLEDLGKFGIEKFYIEKFKEEKISKLYPPQVEIIKKGLFKENFVLSLPTAGGKTFIATLSMINKLQKSRCKIIYIVPLVSLANEKYKYYQNFFKGKYKVAISVGDYDSADPWLSRYDIIIVTSEKLDSLLRHNIDWIREVCLVVVDEIHLLTDPSRGPTLEVLITKLKKIIPKAQFVCLSATIKNVREIADWLDAKYFVSDFRPVKLYEGVAFDSKIYFLNKKGYELKGELEEGITQNLLDLKKQGLFFVSTRRGAESLAEKLSKLVSSRLLRQEKRELQKLSDDILNVLEIPTRQCKRLAKCVKNGVAFHHAGLLYKQRKLIEDHFRNGLIKVIVATPTLCLHPDSLIPLSDGRIVRIRDIKIGDEVISLNPNTLMFERRRVLEKKKRYLSPAEDLLELETVSGKKLLLTSNHPLLTLRKGRLQWVEARNLGKNDFVAFSREVPSFNEFTPNILELLPENCRVVSGAKIFKEITDRLLQNMKSRELAANLNLKLKTFWQYRGKRGTSVKLFILKKLMRVAGWSRERLLEKIEYLHFGNRGSKVKLPKNMRLLARFYGIIIGDGNLLRVKSFRDSWTYMISLTSSDRKWLLQYARLLKTLFGIVTKPRKNTLGEWYISFKSKIIGEILLKLGVPLGKKASIVKISPLFMRNPELLKEVISAIFDCEGSVNLSNRSIEMSTTSKELSQQLQLLLLRFGIFSGVDEREPRKTKLAEFKHKSYRIRITGDDVRKFLEKISFEHHAKKTKSKKIKRTKPTYHYDIIPCSGEFVKELRKEVGISKWMFRKLTGLDYFNYEVMNQNLLRESAEKIARFFGKKSRTAKFLGKIVKSQIRWERIKKIERCEERSEVYDITVEGSHNFLANGFIVHNSYGVNLPAFRVVIRDAKRYYRGFGAAYIPVLEYKQFCGRAGRPQYDSFGESVLCAKTEEEAQELVDRFIMGEPEAITSKLAMEPVLRMHILALISTKFCLSEKSLYDFFSKTFYAYHYGDMRIVNDKISELLELLIKWNFVKRRGKRILPTRIGSRISELYIDPLTAHHFIESIKISKKRKINEFSILQLISNTIEMHPLLSVRVGEFADLEDLLAREEEYILQKIPEEWELEFDDFFRSLKTAMLFYDWINELTEDQLLAKYHVAPGELRGRLEIADWLIYSLSELTRLISYKKILPKIRKLRVRLQYGVKEELLPLVRLKQIGRVRARKLFDVGLTSLSKLRKIPLESLSRVIGPKIAYDIKIQLGQITKKLEEKQTTLK